MVRFLSFLLFCFLTMAFGHSAFAKKEEIKLARIKMFNDLFSIKVPSSYTVMHDYELKKMYSSDNQPKLVYADSTRQTRLAFFTKKNGAEQYKIGAFKDKFLADWLKKDPKLKELANGIETVDGRDMGFIGGLFKVPEKMYRYMFFTDFKGQLLSGELVTPKKGYKIWVELGDEIMKSFQILVKK